MDKLSIRFGELASVWIDLSAVPLADKAWITVVPDTPAALFLKRQHLVCKQVGGGLRIGIPVLGPVSEPLHPVFSTDQVQTCTLLLELTEPAFAGMVKPLATPAPRPVSTNPTAAGKAGKGAKNAESAAVQTPMFQVQPNTGAAGTAAFIAARGSPAVYAVIKLNPISSFIAAKPADRVLTVIFNPK